MNYVLAPFSSLFISPMVSAMYFSNSANPFRKSSSSLSALLPTFLPFSAASWLALSS
jgi:hypothetical protein